MADDDCPHSWERVEDAEGDISEPHLTRHFTWYHCTICDLEQDRMPEDFEECLDE